jgi:Flp pilus assembly pilin Flp
MKVFLSAVVAVIVVAGLSAAVLELGLKREVDQAFASSSTRVTPEVYPADGSNRS